MAGPGGRVPAALIGVHDAIVASTSPYKALNWLRTGAARPSSPSSLPAASP